MEERCVVRFFPVEENLAGLDMEFELHSVESVAGRLGYECTGLAGERLEENLIALALH